MIPGSLFAQLQTYQLILKNDSPVNTTSYEFDIYLVRTGTSILELATLQPIMRFDTAISNGSLSFRIVAGSSELNSTQRPTNGKLSIVGDELRIAPNAPPGSGSGTIISIAPGNRVGRFRLTSTVPFTNRPANIAWKNSGANPTAKVNAYVSGQNISVTDTTGHLNQLTNGSLSPLTITSASSRPTATSLVLYADTLSATGGTSPYSWSLSSGMPPSGFTLSSSGIISGKAIVAEDRKSVV